MSQAKKYPSYLFDFDKRPLSYSSMKHALKSPLHFSSYFLGPKPEPTDALIFGNLLDCLLLTPDEYESRYSIAPKCDRRTKDGKAIWEQHLIDSGGKVSITIDQYESAVAMVASLNSHPLSAPLIGATTTTQRMMKWVDKATGIPLVAKMDAIAMVEGRPIVWDLKSTTSAYEPDFRRDAVSYDYALQMAAYCSAYIRNTGEFPEFRFVVIEKEPPYAVNVFRPDSDFKKLGVMLYRKALDRIAYCVEHDCFDAGYEFMSTGDNNPLSVPYWKMKEME